MTKRVCGILILTGFILTTGCVPEERTTIIMPNPPPVAEPKAVKKRSYIQGNSKVCIYSRMGSEEQIVIDLNSVCPLNL